MAQTKLGVTTLVGLGVLGMMAYAFIAPKLLSKPKVVAEPVAVPAVPVAPPVTVGVPNNMDPPAVDAATGDMDMNFAGVTFAENIPGMSYGFPLSGVV